MPSNEDLYREMLEREQADDVRYKQQGMKQLPRVERRPVNAGEARARYDKDIAPVLEARRRVAAGLPPTRNPLVNLMLKIKGEHKLTELPADQIISPSKGLVIDGPTIADAQRAIAENPEAFRDLAKTPEEARRVDAKRRAPEDLRHD